MYEKGLTLWSILFFYYDVAPLGLLRCRPYGACTPSEADCTPSEADCTPSEAGLYTERSRGEPYVDYARNSGWGELMLMRLKYM